jgi:hypothetical protein
MTRVSERDVAFKHLKDSWDFVFKCIETKSANTDDHEYSYQRQLFENALHYIERYDIRRLKDGVYATEQKEHDCDC